MWVTCFKNMVAEYISFVKQAKKNSIVKNPKNMYTTNCHSMLFMDVDRKTYVGEATAAQAGRRCRISSTFFLLFYIPILIYNLRYKPDI